MNFEKYAAKANEFLNELTRELDEPGNKDRAGRVMRVVFHSLRKTITVPESLQLISQLPMMLKAVYVEGWTLNEQKEKIHSWEDFLAVLRAEAGTTAGRDFGNDQKALKVVQTVMRVLTSHISPGEADDIYSVMSENLRNALRSPAGA